MLKEAIILVLVIMLVSGGFLLGMYVSPEKKDPLAGCKYVFVLGNDKSHVDQEGEWLVLIEPQKFECRNDWKHDEKYPAPPVNFI